MKLLEGEKFNNSSKYMDTQYHYVKNFNKMLYFYVNTVLLNL